MMFKKKSLEELQQEYENQEAKAQARVQRRDLEGKIDEQRQKGRKDHKRLKSFGKNAGKGLLKGLDELTKPKQTGKKRNKQ